MGLLGRLLTRAHASFTLVFFFCFFLTWLFLVHYPRSYPILMLWYYYATCYFALSYLLQLKIGGETAAVRASGLFWASAFWGQPCLFCFGVGMGVDNKSTNS